MLDEGDELQRTYAAFQARNLFLSSFLRKTKLNRQPFGVDFVKGETVTRKLSLPTKTQCDNLERLSSSITEHFMATMRIFFSRQVHSFRSKRIFPENNGAVLAPLKKFTLFTLQWG